MKYLKYVMRVVITLSSHVAHEKLARKSMNASVIPERSCSLLGAGERIAQQVTRFIDSETISERLRSSTLLNHDEIDRTQFTIA